MYTCKICQKSFELQRAYAGHLKIHKKSPKQIAYEESPKLCKECGGIIPYKAHRSKHNIKFCSGSCRTSHYNKLRYKSPKFADSR